MNLIKLLTAEFQKNPKIYTLIDNFFKILSSRNWIKNYIFWELELLKFVGYDLNINQIVDKEVVNNKIKYYVKSNTEKKFVPNFLVDIDQEDLNNDDLLKGLKLVGDYLEKSILIPNNISFPTARLDFVNILKWFRNKNEDYYLNSFETWSA